MSLLIKYRPTTLEEFVGARARAEAYALLNRRLKRPIEVKSGNHCKTIATPMLVAVIEDFGCGKSVMARLLSKGHFCSMGATGGPCGTCAACISFEEQYDRGQGWLITSATASRTPTTQEPGVYSFRTVDCTNTNIDQLRALLSAIGPSGYFQGGFIQKAPEVIVLDEVQRIDTGRQQSFLVPFQAPLFASVVLCIARANYHKLDEALKQRFHLFYLGKPEFGELVAFTKAIAKKEAIFFANESAVEDLVEAARLVPRLVLRFLDMATLEDKAITSAWVEEMRLRIQPHKEQEDDQDGGVL
jgi:DNA polymerase III gamma/tau subunit